MTAAFGRFAAVGAVLVGCLAPFAGADGLDEEELEPNPALARLKAIEIPNCEITRAKVAKDGIAEVDYVLRPTKDSFIQCALALPKPGAWNGGFRGLGSAGAGGWVRMPSVHEGAATGCATAYTDMGTSKGVRSIETVIDFGHRATHLMTTSAKALTEAYFGSPVKFSVFDGWSTGGGQGFHEAIRYPEDYDGILAGVPANARLPLHIYFAWNERQAKDAAGKDVFTPAELEAVRKAAHDLAAPDLPEWARGKLIPDSRWTAAGEKAVLARAKELAPTLDDPDKIARLERIFRGPSIGGRQIHAGVPFGASLKDAYDNPWLLDWWLKLSRKGKPRSKVTDEDLLAWEREWGPHLDATSENLDRFFAHGGKLIVYGGLADSMVPYPSMIDWYERAARHNPKAIAENCRFYLIPGRAHCPGGSILGLWKDLDLILNWVRKGERPERVMIQSSGLFPMYIVPYPTFPQIPRPVAGQ